MKYTAQFYDINDKLYSLEIGTGTAQAITLSDTPFISELETEDNIYKPCKYSSATIGMITDDYKFDLYSSTAQLNKVTLSDVDGVVWVGYVTPNLYSQGYECEFEQIEIEAIDALSTLLYYKYKTIGTGKEIVSFLDIVRTCLLRCNAYSNFYVSYNFQYNSSEMFSRAYISEQNFFDEEDEAMTYQEVLEEVCRYMNLTAVANGDSVYLMNYDAIKAGNNQYYRYSVNTADSGTLVTVSHSKTITAADYTENGGQLSLDEIYNKASVVDNLYSFESIIPSIWNEDNLTNYGDDWSSVLEVNESFKGENYKCYFKYFKHKNYTSYYYHKDTKSGYTPTTVNYAITLNYIGATICQHKAYKGKDLDDINSDLGLTDYVLLHVHDTYDNTARPLFTLTINDSLPSFLGSSAYIIIKGNFKFIDRESKMFDIVGYSNKDDNFNPNNLYINCELLYGNKYWNGTEWTTTRSTFKLYFDNNGLTSHCINLSFPVKNNVTWLMGIDEEGYSIPMPTLSNEVLTGKPTFTLYQPHRLDGSYRCDAVWLSNFDIIAKVPSFEKESENDSDTKYLNVINEEFVNEMQDIDFKICTWDNKEANYSAVCLRFPVNGGYSYQFIDQIYNRATLQNLRPEEHLIYSLVTQYSTPSTILSINIKNELKPYSLVTTFSDKLFIVDSYTTDYRLASTNVQLKEKK